jgi:hypothetical protein
MNRVRLDTALSLEQVSPQFAERVCGSNSTAASFLIVFKKETFLWLFVSIKDK